MAQNAKHKKRDPLEQVELCAGSRLKVSQAEDGKIKVRGDLGYETVFLRKQLHEGLYYLEVEDLTSKERKPNPKACFRLGVYCQTEESDAISKPRVYSLGSAANSIAYRVKDSTVIMDGKAIFKSKTTQAESQDSSEEEESETEEAQESVVYSVLLGISKPKNPQLIKYYKNKLDWEELVTSEDSFVAFFKNGKLECGLRGLREGVYSLGVSLFNEAQVSVDLEREERVESVSQQLCTSESGENSHIWLGAEKNPRPVGATELAKLMGELTVQSLRHAGQHGGA